MPSLFLLLGRWSFCCSSPHFTGSEVVMQHKQNVQNRVDEILDLTEGQEWHHCLGPENPSDIGSRSALPSKLPQTSAANLEPAFFLNMCFLAFTSVAM